MLRRLTYSALMASESTSAEEHSDTYIPSHDSTVLTRSDKLKASMCLVSTVRAPTW